MSGVNLKSLDRSKVKSVFEGFDTILSDCDGVLYLHNTVIKGVPESVKRLKDGGKRFLYVTNNPICTRKEFSEKLQALGYDAKPEEVICTSYLVANYLKNINFNKKVYLVGCNGIGQELDSVGISHIGMGADITTPDLKTTVQTFVPDPEVGAVVVGGDIHFSYPKIMKAASYVSNPNVLFLATSMDAQIPLPSYVIPGPGALVKCIEVCAHRKATVLGKPEPYIRKVITENFSINPDRTLFIGDSPHTDVRMGKRSGFKTLLVLTGLTDEDKGKSFNESTSVDSRELIPDFYIHSLADLSAYL